MPKPRFVATIIERKHLTRRPPKEVFAFFDRPINLKRVLPGSIAVTLGDMPEELRPGRRFRYRLERWPLDLKWETVVSEYRPPQGFTGVKAVGYFASFSLAHEIAPTRDGTELRLRLAYEVPPGIYAKLSDAYVIRDAMEEFVSELTRSVGEALDRGE